MTDSTENLSNEQLKKLLLVGMDRYPEGISTILSTEKDDYLIRENDKMLLFINREPVLESTIAREFIDSDNKKFSIDKVFDIPFYSRVVFQGVTELQLPVISLAPVYNPTKSTPAGKFKIKKITTEPIVSKSSLNEAEAVKYLLKKD